MKQTKILSLLVLAVMLCTSMTACGNSKKSIEKLSDLSGASVACLSGSTGEIYANGIVNATVTPFNTGLEAVQALQNGDTDAVIMDEAPAQIYTAHIDAVKIIDQKIDTEPYVIACKKGNEKLATMLNETLSTLKTDGTIDEILSHWVGSSADHVSYLAKEQNTKGELIMATVANLPPFAETEGSVVVGLEPDIMRAICDKLGMSLVIKEMASTDAVLDAVKAGKADVAMSRITVQKDYITRASFTESYFESEQVIIARS